MHGLCSSTISGLPTTTAANVSAPPAILPFTFIAAADSWFALHTSCCFVLSPRLMQTEKYKGRPNQCVCARRASGGGREAFLEEEALNAEMLKIKNKFTWQRAWMGESGGDWFSPRERHVKRPVA